MFILSIKVYLTLLEATVVVVVVVIVVVDVVVVVVVNVNVMGLLADFIIFRCSN